MMEKIFTQTATWKETIPAGTSLSAETVTSHALAGVRVSMISDGRSLDGYGWRSSDSSVLYYLSGTSTIDGSKDIPSFKEGDQITIEGKTLTVVSVNAVYGLSEGLHHLEVALR